MSKRKEHSVTSFQEDWLTNDDYKTWARKVDNPKKAYCTLCRTTFDIANGGSSALNSHQKGQTHSGILQKQKEDRIGGFFKARPAAGESVGESQVQTVSTSGKLPYVMADDVLDAEIVWCLHMVHSHLSYRSCDPIPPVFQRIFKTCPIAQQFHMKKDKAKYMIVYGLYPALKVKLQARINASTWFSVSFDESLNRHQQKCQMDINIRFWDNEKHIAQSVYYDSKFLLRPNAPNLKEEVFNSIEDLSMAKFLHLAMDGPSTNWNVLDLVNEHLVDNGFLKTLIIGSCSLHILHGAFQTGMTKPDWSLGKVLRALYKIFDESPARRDVYLREGTSGKFPLKFCATRWIEDKAVAEQALEVWSSVVSTVKYWQSLCKSKRPQKNNSYDTLVEHHLDLLMPAKLHYFSFIAGILKPYLVVFQSDNPLLPFMFDELSLILYRLLRLVFKKEKVDEAANLRQVMKKEFLTEKSNQLEEYLIDLGAATNDALKKINIAPEKKRKFREGCKEVVVFILLKLLERLPTNHLIVVNASSLSPVNMARIPSKVQKRFKKLADGLFSLKFITSAVADNAKFQFDRFLKNEVVLNQEKFLKFNFRTDRVDSFLYPFVGINTEYADLWKVAKLIFVVSHGQSFTERGFSINKITSDVNMEGDSLVAQRFVYDAMSSAGADAGDFPITKEIRQSCKKARLREKLAQEKKKGDVQKTERELKRKSKEEEIKEIKRRKLDLEKTIQSLKQSLCDEAIASDQNSKDGRDHATKAASFAKTLKEKEVTYKELSECETKVQDEYKAMLK